MLNYHVFADGQSRGYVAMFTANDAEHLMRQVADFVRASRPEFIRCGFTAYVVVGTSHFYITKTE